MEPKLCRLLRTDAPFFGPSAAQESVWVSLARFGAPPGSLLAPRGCLWAPFSLPLAPFSLPFAPFWFPFRVLWLTFAHPKATFSNLCGLLPSFLHFSKFPMKILRKIFVLFRKLSLGNQVVRQPNRSTPKTAECTPTEIKSSFAPHRSRTRR